MKTSKPKDLQHLLSVLTVKRLINLVKIFLSYRHSVFYKKPWMFAMPYALSIEPNNTCTLKCTECPTGNNLSKGKKGMMLLEDFEHILENIPKEVFYVNLYFLGESLMNPSIIEMIKKLKAARIYVSLSTNAQFLDKKMANLLVESGLDKLIVSLDGYDQESYEIYRSGGDYQKVIDGINCVVEARNEFGSAKPFLVMQTLLLHSTENKIEKFRDLSKMLGVDALELKTSWFDLENLDFTRLPETDTNRRYSKGIDGKWHIKNKLKNSCFRMWSSAVINWQGEVIPCCFDKDISHSMGNAIKKPLHEIWRGSEYFAFRQQILKNRKSISMCQNCTEGMDKIKRS